MFFLGVYFSISFYWKRDRCDEDMNWDLMDMR